MWVKRGTNLYVTFENTLPFEISDLPMQSRKLTGLRSKVAQNISLNGNVSKKSQNITALLKLEVTQLS